MSHGSVVWNMSHSCIEDVCVAWRRGLRRALSLPSRTHCALLPRVTGMLPLRDELLLCRTARFITSCLNRKTLLCSLFLAMGYILVKQVLLLVWMLNCAVPSSICRCLCSINTKCVWRYITLEENVYSVTAIVIYDLLLVKSKRAEISVLSVCDVDCMIDYLCVN